MSFNFKPLTPSLHSTSFYPHKWEWELTTSLHFLIVSWFPRLNVEFRALAEKLTDDNVSDKFEILGHTFTTSKTKTNQSMNEERSRNRSWKRY